MCIKSSEMGGEQLRIESAAATFLPSQGRDRGRVLSYCGFYFTTFCTEPSLILRSVMPRVGLARRLPSTE